MAQRMPYVGGNWKMSTDLAGGVALAEAVAPGASDLLSGCQVVVCPPGVGQVRLLPPEPALVRLG